MAQLVNVIPAISTFKGGIRWAQCIYYPLYCASLYVRGESLQLNIDYHTYSTDIADDVTYIDDSGIIRNDNNTFSFFIINSYSF